MPLGTGPFRFEVGNAVQPFASAKASQLATLIQAVLVARLLDIWFSAQSAEGEVL